MRGLFTLLVGLLLLLAACGDDAPEPCTGCSSNVPSERFIVDIVAGVATSAENLAGVILFSHEPIFLDMTTDQSPSQIRELRSYRADRRPVHFELFAGTRVIETYLLPIESEVYDLTIEEYHVTVTLVRSAMVYVVLRSHSRYPEFVELLVSSRENQTPLLITATRHNNNIIDVRLPLYAD